MGRKKGRPTIAYNQKKISVSISLTRVQLEILDVIAERDQVNRSDIIRELIEGAGYTKAGIMEAGEIKEHKSTQGYQLPKSKLFACNPYLLKGRCEHPQCQAAYSKEGI